MRREFIILSYLKSFQAQNGPVVNVRGLFRRPGSLGWALATELVGGPRLDSLMTKFTPPMLRAFASELLGALDSLHSKSVMHRDLKPQNIFFDPQTRKLKLIDFGQAEFWLPEQLYSPRVGCKFFKAPELLLESPTYHYAIDIWAAGVILLSIISGLFPYFLGTDTKEILLKIAEFSGWEELNTLRVTFKKEKEPLPPGFTKKGLSEVKGPLASPEALSLCAKLLTLAPQTRPSAKEALNHPFFKLSEE